MATPLRRDGTSLQRAGWTLVWLSVIRTSFGVTHYWTMSSFAAVLALVMAIGGLAALVAVWTVRRPSGQVMQMAAFAGMVVSILFPISFAIHQTAFYPTDSAALDHFAAYLLAHGRNPYAVSLAPAGRFLHPAAAFWTYTTSGSHVVQMSYPAGSVLAYMPAYLLGLHHLVVSWTDLASWVLGAALLWVLVPVNLRFVVALLAMTPVFVGDFGLGGTDSLWLPWMILAVWRWDRFASPGARWVRWAGPVALGIACSIKQTPWFFVPVFAIGLGLEASRQGRVWWRVSAAYTAIVLGVFAVVNLPFIAWQPYDWWKAVTLPLLGGLVADGQGFVSLATHGIVSGVDLTALSAAALFSYVAILVAFALWYSSLKRAIVVLLPFAFVLASRSLSVYLVNFVPVAVVAGISVSRPGGQAVPEDAVPVPGPARPVAATDPEFAPAVTPELPPKLWRMGLAALVLLFAAIIASSTLAFSVQPVRVTVDRVQPVKNLLYVRSITVTVHNDTGSAVEPHLTVDTGFGTAGFWRVANHRRPVVIPPHGSVTLRLLPLIGTPLPAVGGALLVEAYTPHPDALSLTSVVWNGPPPKS